MNKDCITPEEIQKHLEQFDWDAFWKRVQEKIDKDITAYEIARAKSKEQARNHILI